MARQAKQPTAAASPAPAADEYVPPPVVDVQAMVEPRRALPRAPDSAQVEAAHQDSLAVASSEYEQSHTRLPDVDPELIEKARAASIAEARAMLPPVPDRAAVIEKERRVHEENQALIRAEMDASVTTVVSSR